MPPTDPEPRKPATTPGLALAGALRKPRVMPDTEVDWTAWIVAIEDEARLRSFLPDDATPPPPTDPTAALRTALYDALERIVENELRGVLEWRTDLTRLTDVALSALASQADDPSGPDVCDWCMRPKGEHAVRDLTCPNRAETHWSVILIEAAIRAESGR